MNRENAGRTGECRVFVIQSLQQYRNKGGLPVVAVQDIGSPQDLRRLKHGTREHGESFSVVVVITQLRAIQSVAVEERRVVDEIELHS